MQINGLIDEVVLENFIQWLESNMMACHTKETTGFDCFGCGTQRSIILLLKGDFTGSFLMYPALIPTILMIIFLVIHLKMKFEHGAAILKWMFIFNVLLMIVNMVLKNFFI